jgi:hypothetical protein
MKNDEKVLILTLRAAHFAALQHFKGPGTAHGQCRGSIPPIRASASVKIDRKIAGLWLPRQLGLVDPLTALVLEEIRINLANDAGVRLQIGPSGLDWRRGYWRGAGRRGVYLL